MQPISVEKKCVGKNYESSLPVGFSDRASEVSFYHSAQATFRLNAQGHSRSMPSCGVKGGRLRYPEFIVRNTFGFQSMLTFLFWNLKTKNVNVLTNLVKHHNVDVLILAECPLLQGTILQSLNKPTVNYQFAPCECKKLQIYTRFSNRYVLPVSQGTQIITGNDFTLRLLRLPGRDEILLCAAHFPSKLRQHPVDQLIFTTQFANILAQAEEAASHSRTILVGDLNMNPYEDGMVATAGLHAVSTRRIALKERRRVKFNSHLYFYNPMWAHFGENEEGHAGTYYFSKPKARADFWNIYDQVLVRPTLLPYFRDEDVKILWQDELSGESLIETDGIPNDTNISDHLPLLFQINI